MSDALEVVLATANPDKAAEIAAILGSRVVLLPRPDEVAEVIEDGDTLTANARLKAVAISDYAQKPALADDTGLEVDALDGAPGIYAARYAGPEATYADNRDKMLAELAEVTDPTQRTARFRTVALLHYPDGTEAVAEGVVEGVITEAPRGGGGFGYDPIFVPVDGDGRTFSEMSDDEKHLISHRSRAFEALLSHLAANP